MAGRRDFGIIWTHRDRFTHFRIRDKQETMMAATKWREMNA